MRMLFKWLGLLTLLFVCTAIGFLKAYSLKGRFDELLLIRNGILKLKERIRLHFGDKTRLIKDCFPIYIDEFKNLNAGDKALFEEFLSNLGKGDTQEEIERCAAYISLFADKLQDAKNEYDEQQKLYKTLGFLSGIFICIFLW